EPAAARRFQMSGADTENLPPQTAHPSVAHGAGLERNAECFGQREQLVVVAAAMPHQHPNSRRLAHLARTRRYSPCTWIFSVATLATVPRTKATAAPITPHFHASGAIDRKKTALPISF